MKAAFVVSSLSRKGGGVTEVARLLARQLSTFSELNVQSFGLRDECTLTDIGAWDPVLTFDFAVRGPHAFGYAPHLMSAVRRAAADVVHCHGLWMYPSVASSAAAIAGRSASVVSPHGMLDPWALRNSAWKKRIAGILFERTHLRRASCLHALCEPELAAIRAAGFTNPVCLIPNGVHLPLNTRPSAQAVAEKTSAQRVLLYIGRLHPKKGLDTLLEAWALLRTRCPHTARDWTLAIAGWEGSAGYERHLHARAVELSIGDTVAFLGPVYGGAKLAALNSASAFVLASVSEGMPIAVLEAWAHNLPVVMTPECNIAASFEVGAAIRVEASVPSLTSGLETLMAMSDIERSKMGANGRRLVERAYTWEIVAEKMRSVYQWLAGAGSRPDCVMELGRPKRHA